jgi:ribosomal protein S18 acetylase RimI-like enzyme
MSQGLTVRRYRPDDDQRVRELHEEALRAAGGFVEGAREPDLDDVEGSYFDDDGEFLVGEVDGRVVAMGGFQPTRGYITEFVEDCSPASAEIKRMRVDPSFQRQGHGQRIYDELERRAIDGGYTDLVLDTSVDQTGARRFYEKNGFELVNRESVAAYGESFEMVFYRKSLTESET